MKAYFQCYNFQNQIWHATFRFFYIQSVRLNKVIIWKPIADLKFSNRTRNTIWYQQIVNSEENCIIFAYFKMKYVKFAFIKLLIPKQELYQNFLSTIYLSIHSCVFIQQTQMPAFYKHKNFKTISINSMYNINTKLRIVFNILS